MPQIHLRSWTLVPVLAALCVACTFDTAGLKSLSQNNGNNLNNTGNPMCGDNVIGGDETCDGTDLAGQTCVSRGFDSGTLACAIDCASFVTAACQGSGPVCGDNVIGGDETCAGTDLAGQTCVSLGYLSGDLGCADDCTTFDASGCFGATCGNSVVEGIELCDGANLAGNSCTGLGFAAGDLACDADCLGFDTSGCSTQACGNNHVEGAEACDGSDLAGQTCLTQGFYGGTLLCNAGCTAFVTTGCSLCGNEVINAPEVCDGSNLNGQSCLTQGCRVPGTLLCNTNCSAFLLTGCWINHDEDADGVDDNCDNCPTYANPGQANADGDQIGDVCESPAGASALGTINVFESMNTSVTTWTTVRGTWTPGTDQIAGTAGTDTDGNYLHPLSLPANNYSVEVNFTYRADGVAGSKWAGVIFGWQTSGGNLSNAYECLFERDTKELQIWKYTTYNNMGWVFRTSVVVTTSATNAQLRKVRGYAVSPTVRCDYSDASGATATVSWTDPYIGANSFTGKAGYRLYNESANFTSFVYYLP